MASKSGGRAAYIEYQRVLLEGGHESKAWDDLAKVQRMGWEAGAQRAVKILLPKRGKYTVYPGEGGKEIED